MADEKKTGLAIVLGIGKDAKNLDRDDKSCVNDAKRMAKFAKARGFQLFGPSKNGGGREETPFISEDATREAVTGALIEAAEKLEKGDILLVFFSGHGYMREVEKETVEAWLLFDGYLWEHRWRELLRKFKAGVRVLVITDSCFTGGFGPPEQIDDLMLPVATREVLGIADLPMKPRVLPLEVANSIFDPNDGQFEDVNATSDRDPRAMVLLLAACQANQSAYWGEKNGDFTDRLLDILEKDFDGNYRVLYSTVRRRFTTPLQSPFYWSVGPQGDPFGHEKAFVI